MKKEHQVKDFRNPLRNLAGNEYYEREPSSEEILDHLLNAMAAFNGTCWAPVERIENGQATAWNLMLHQCPGACGYVWKVVIRDKDMKGWLVNEINARRIKHGDTETRCHKENHNQPQ